LMTPRSLSALFAARFTMKKVSADPGVLVCYEFVRRGAFVISASCPASTSRA
jgi:hypothetical protein